MPVRRGLLLAGLMVLSLGIAMLLSASTFAGPSAGPADGVLTIVDIEAGCGPGGVTGTVTVRNTGDEPVTDTIPLLLMQHIPPSRGGQADFFPVPGGAFTVSVSVDAGETVVVPFGPLSTANVDPDANSLRVDTDVATRPDLNPEKSESFGPCPGVTPTATRTATATPVDTFTPTATGTATVDRTDTPTSTKTSVPTATETGAPTDTATATKTAATPTETATSVATFTETPTATQTAPATDTPTPTGTAVETTTNTPTATATEGGSPTSTRTAVPTHSPTRTNTPVRSPSPTDTVIAATPTPTRVNITLPGTPPSRRTPVPQLPPTGGPPSPGEVPAWWLLAGAMMSLAGAGLVLKAFADGRRALPPTLYVEISGLESFRDFYDIVAAMRSRLSARATTAVSFFATQGRAEVRVDGLSGDEASVGEAASGPSRQARVRRQGRDRIRLDLD